MKIGYLGPRTNSEIAVRKLKSSAEQVSFGTMTQVFDALSLGVVDQAIIPVRNSITKNIEDHLEQIKLRGFRVVDELTIPIIHCFGKVKVDVGFILSHTQVLKQSAVYLEKKFPEVYKEAVPSTDFAARFVSEIRNGAAIAPLQTCKHYGLIIVDQDIVKGNTSTFYVCENKNGRN